MAAAGDATQQTKSSARQDGHVGRSATPAPLLLDLDNQRQLITSLELDTRANWFLENVWLTYLAWWDDRARRARRQYRFWRAVVLVGGAATPSLIGFSIGGGSEAIEWAAWATGLAVAIAAALETLYRWGDIWREKRAAGERLKVEGWRFLHLTGPYLGRTHTEAFSEFAETVERFIEAEIGDYLAAAIPRGTNDKNPKDSGAGGTTVPVVDATTTASKPAVS
jgi:uncharacterized protein DUF4231